MDQITDPSDLRKYRTELPNIIDDLGLDVFERALYGHYKRVCGANGGTCYESTRTTASKIPGMSAGKVSLTRRELVAKGLLIETQEHTVHVTMVDIWDLNFAFYSYQGDRPDIAGWTIPQLQEWVNKSVYHINTNDNEEEECLPGKQSVYEVNTKAEKCLPGKTKNKQLLKKEPNKEGGAKKSADPTYLPEAEDQLSNLFPRAQGNRDYEQAIKDANWRINNTDHRQAMALWLEASRLDVPFDKSARGDWLKSIDLHLKSYSVEQLKFLYPRVVAEMRGDRITVSRPGSVTSNLADFVARERSGNNGNRNANQPRGGVRGSSLSDDQKAQLGL